MRKIVVGIMVLFVLCAGAGARMAEVWTKTFPLEAENAELAGDIGVEWKGNGFYLTGLKCVPEGTNTRGTVAVRKLDADGKVIWKQICDIGLGGVDSKNTLAVDASNNVFVGGYKYVGRNGRNAWIRKYDQNGNVLWDRTWENLYGSRDAKIMDLETSPDGSLYAVGYKNTDNLVRELWIRRYDLDGNELWSNAYGSSVSPNEQEQGLTVDISGNAYVAAYQDGDNQEVYLSVKRYGPDGTLQKAMRFPDNRVRARAVSEIAVDAAGNIYILGSESVFYQGRNIFVRKISPAGGNLWSISYPNTGYQHFGGNGIKLDKDMNLYVSATGSGEKNEKKYSWISKLDSDGNELATMDYFGYAFGVDFSVGRNSDIYVMGNSADACGFAEIWVKKYAQIP